MSETDATVLRLQRTFEASAEEVFDAWTNPEVLRRWWAAGDDWNTPVAEVDLRVGGHYRLSMEDPATGARHTVGGEYREVRRPQRLIYTWCWELQDGGLGETSTVTVEFRGEDGLTTVAIEHTGLPSVDSRDRHGHGWGACLKNLQTRVFQRASHTA
jgi:uncharacterized protein YndB with AHSA1/START domain